jgi:hypothetical protein
MRQVVLKTMWKKFLNKGYINRIGKDWKNIHKTKKFLRIHFAGKQRYIILKGEERRVLG